MKMHRIALLVVICLAIFFVAGLAAQNTDPDAAAGNGATRWQHLQLTHDADKGAADAELSRSIVRLGNEGWELVAVESLTKDGTTTQTIYCFKKPK